MRNRLLGLAMGLLLAACLEPPGYACSADSECLVNGVPGMCNPAVSRCEYPAAHCMPSGLQDGAGNCIEGPGTTSGDGSTSTAGSSSDADADPTIDPTTSSTTSTTGGSSTTDEGTSTTDETEGTTSVGPPCNGAMTNITGFGVVGASTVFTGYPPGLSVDGDLGTSWFSTGPEGAGVPSVFRWTLGSPRCISNLYISGNGLNNEPGFQQGYGFETVNFRVLDAANEVLFEETRDLTGTPDPDVSVDVPGVLATRVVLEFFEHEANDCGGFSELQVLGE